MNNSSTEKIQLYLNGIVCKYDLLLRKLLNFIQRKTNLLFVSLYVVYYFSLVYAVYNTIHWK